MTQALTLVSGPDPAALPCPNAGYAGLHGKLAVVLSTCSQDATDMVFDHVLWASCMKAVGAFFGADETRVLVNANRGFFQRLKGAPSMRVWGNLEHYVAGLLAAPDEHTWWQEVHWLRAGEPMAMARCENWFAVGGPAPYHDSYTSRIWTQRSQVDELAQWLEQNALAEGAPTRRILAGDPPS